MVPLNMDKRFREERPRQKPAKVKFHDRLMKGILKMFSEMGKKKRSCKLSGHREIVIKADRKLFAQIIIIAQSQNLQKNDVLKQPLGPIP